MDGHAQQIRCFPSLSFYSMIGGTGTLSEIVDYFKNMGKLPAALAILSFSSFLSVLYFALSSTIVSRSNRIARDNMKIDVLQFPLPNVSQRYPHTDENPSTTIMTDAVTSKNAYSDGVTVITSNASSAVPAVPTTSVASPPGSTSQRGGTKFKTNAGLTFTSQSSQRSVQKPHFKGVGLKSLFQQTERTNLTAVSPKKPPPAGSDMPATTKCNDNLCTQYLSPSDQSYFSHCQRTAKIDHSSDQNARCHFMDGRGRDPVALVSVPGAGNTWVRSLIEKASGICTGAIYCDQAIRRGGFVGEYIQSGSVSVVKTHTSDYQWKGERIEKRNREDALYSSAILLIRSPFDTFVSERNRVVTLRQLGGKAEHGIYAPVPFGKLDSSHVHALNSDYFGMCCIIVIDQTVISLTVTFFHI